MRGNARSWGLSLVIGASLGLGALGSVALPAFADQAAAPDSAGQSTPAPDAAEVKPAEYSASIGSEGGATLTITVADGTITDIEIDAPDGVSLSDLNDALADCANQAELNTTADTASDSQTGAQGIEQTLGVADVDWLVNQQPLHVVNTQYLVQSDQYKALYPDLLSATIENSGTDDIRDAVIAIVAWDANGLPVKIKGQFDFSDGKYVALVNFDAINMVPGAMYGSNSGLPLDADCNNIAMFKATVVSYTRFDDTTWGNPYFDLWKQMYEGVKYSDDMTIEAVVEQQ